MLKQMRAEAKHLKFVLWLVIASFLVSFVFLLQGGAGSVERGPEGAYAAKVGDAVITVGDFQGALERRHQALRQERGGKYDPSLLDGPAVLDRLIDERLLLDEAKRLGIVVTPEQLAEALRAMPAFQDAEGRFDRERYEETLAFNEMQASEFERDIADDLRLLQLDDIIRGGAVVSDAAVRAAWIDENDSANIEYVQVPIAEFEPAVTTTEDELRAHFQARPLEFGAGEARQVRWAAFRKADFLASLENEAEMRARYERDLESRYTIGEDQRRASLLLVAIPEDADEHVRNAARDRADRAVTGARGGSDFAVLVGGWSDDLATNDVGGDLGPFGRGILDPKIEEAVWAAAEGDVLGPIATKRGLEILKVTKGPGRKARTFEDVRDLVALDLYSSRAHEALEAAVARLQAAHAEKADFEAAARAAGVEPEGPAWMSRTSGIEGVDDGSGGAATSAAAFATAKGALSPPIEVPAGRLILAVVDERDASAGRTFEDARADVEKSLRARKARELARAEAERIREAAVYAEVLQRGAGDRPIQFAGPFRKEGPIQGLGDAPDVLAAVFQTRIGEFGRVASAPDGEVVFFVNARRRPEMARFENDRQSYGQLQRELRADAVRRDLLAGLRRNREAEIVINPGVLAPFNQGRQAG